MMAFEILCFFVAFVVALVGVGLAVQALIEAGRIKNMLNNQDVRIQLLEEGKPQIKVWNPDVSEAEALLAGVIPIRACKATEEEFTAEAAEDAEKEEPK